MLHDNKKLQLGLTQLQLTVSLDTQSQLLAYLQLLQKWNKTYNLTAITNFEKMISHHLLDSLSVSPYLKGDDIVDVGSGAGLPGIPLAIYFPEKKFTLIDSIGKKVRFMSHAVNELGLKNVQVLQTRAEEYQTQNGFDTMIARAVASIDELIKIAQHLLNENGVLMMMKSDELPEEKYHARVEKLNVPGIDTNRMLIIMEKSVWQK
ncbi:MAG: 16S rRNA (guanine(527)-N(7))-methyltransferase RsmG [Gammaproteobacteria bacterium CG_4_10_14_0_8_um_filter_38_16]|nr:MAG: 16S rRNA (guanine(527)-N(7))-methyltransferase RsmG [Gammaproteobacteria bacterium CG_4_10_14_0_8_um_filter_38_16]PJA03975.1 MAG: 16S rRNA (guanine(527)-N(7))-methyltransferase RsmG [Gammaproteobacteria bacterium CG_4_10_14_0_2_um_filter_38_22]PJB09758.1 MAG: 16S rRNA (guanine(527)-N(7))-methyltransferase RsmG [Gammaproteobacteria bacterium CG_4_9_14_3_um_filter_38_9]